jgi:glycosyltransferase involved in cell wall biosynthesis
MIASKLENPLVSVIMAVKNGERFVAEAIDSILAQDYQPCEIIVVDGQSTDSTAEIVKSYTSLHYVWQTGKGIADAYNTGIRAAKGELIAFLSHDDIWSSNKITVQVNYLLKHPDIQYVVTKFKYFLEEGYPIPPGLGAEYLDRIHTGIITETLCARRDLFNIVGSFDTEFKVAEDTDWFARAIDYKMPMAVIPEVLLFKRVHNQNTSLANLNDTTKLVLKAMRKSIHRKRSL